MKETSPLASVSPVFPRIFLLALRLMTAVAGGSAGLEPLHAEGFTRLLPLAPPRVVESAEAVLLTGNNPVENLVDGNPRTEYASAGKGLQTYVVFDFGAPTTIAGFRHQDRKNGTIAGSELVLLDEAGRVLRTIAVTHPDRSGAVTFQPIWPAVSARRVRWQVTKLGIGNAGAVGGAEITFFKPGAPESTPTAATLDAVALPIATREGTVLHQPLRVTIDYPYAESVDAILRLQGEPDRPLRLSPGPQTIEFSIPIAKSPRPFTASVLDRSGAVLARRNFDVPAFRELTIYVLPHSHVDIGFTEIQSAIAEKQLNNLLTGMAAAQQTAGYPEGSRFVWNLEGLWPADLLYRRLGREQQQAFEAAVRSGHVALNGMYFNTLTGLCRPEELVRLFRFGAALKTRLGVPLDAAMISDVPGYTWGTVTALSQAGIKYFSAAPNVFDRIGDTYVQWENKPFWWVGASGHDRVLVWVPFGGYNLAARIGRISPEWVAGFTEELVRGNFPYDITYIRWSRGDNAAPGVSVSDNVRDWNAAHPWPRFVIGNVHQAFSALEQKYGPQIPEYRGDWTPYWEDGAGSSALETALNRTSSDRLAQAEALWAIHDPATYPAPEFTEAMRQILLYDEHTWGASSAVTKPDGAAALEQWAVKHSYPVTAENTSRDLLARALALPQRGGASVIGSVDVHNASSWPRSGLAVLTRDMSAPGDRVTDAAGAPVPSQRLTNGELVLFARDVPPYGARRYTVSKGSPHVDQAVTISGNVLENGRLKVVVDPRSGAITELHARGVPSNLADGGAGPGLNSYRYFNGDDPSTARGESDVTIRVGERGPLVASLIIECRAPGTYGLVREVKLVAGADTVEISDVIDKQRLVAKDYRAPDGKESVNIAFPFAVPGGQVRLEVPYGVIRPDRDQIPGACKNWFTINRWADVSNAEFGVTLIALDSPLIEVGGLTAHLLNSQTNPAVWRKTVEPTQTLYAWVMNNHWGTNYRAYQEGPVTFRFLLRPHGAYDPGEASRTAIAASQPLRAIRAYGPTPTGDSRLTVDSADVIVTGLKPSDDGNALIVRLWAAAGRDVTTRLQWNAPHPKRIYLSDTSEQPLREAAETIRVPAWGLVTLRAELR